MRAIIIERWAILRHGVRAVLGQGGHPVIRTASSAAEGHAAIAARPDVELIVLGGTADGPVVPTTAALAAATPDARIVVLLDTPRREEVAALFEAGASALLGRLAEEGNLLDAVTRVERGERVLSSEVIEALLPGAEIPRGMVMAVDGVTSREAPVLSRREQEVLHWLQQGATNREIADQLFIGQATVKTHLSSIYTKLGASSRHHAVRKALEVGLLDGAPPPAAPLRSEATQAVS